MDKPKFQMPEWKLKKWQTVALVIVILFIIGSLTGGKSSDTDSTSSSSSSSAASSADVGTHMACEHWRINLGNASVETRAQQITGAQDVNRSASVSTIPEIVQNGRLMTEAFLQQDSEKYLTYATAFGNACTAAGE